MQHIATMCYLQHHVAPGMSSNIRVQRICEFCEKQFTARTTVTRCCSDACAKRMYKRRKRDEKITVSEVKVLVEGCVSLEDWKLREYFSLNELTKLVGVSRWTLWRAIKRNEIQAGKIGGRVIIKRDELNKFFINVPHHGSRQTQGEAAQRQSHQTLPGLLPRDSESENG
ncbi:MAG: DNA-binding protein [Chitinophagaceae bacterium]|nr:MAG: DNA-binding protein [Chitinophagaceae bacterium]